MNVFYSTNDNSVNRQQEEKPDRNGVKAKDMEEEMENPNRINYSIQVNNWKKTELRRNASIFRNFD